jgi:hypothetical protein
MLGFSNFVEEDTRGALTLLQNYQTQLYNWQHINSNLPTAYKRDSFLYMIPFSDSIFFYSKNASDFVLQLASFIHDCFSFTSNAFVEPEDELFPENVTEYALEHDGDEIVKKEYQAKWYPLLFRGGIGFGDVSISHLNSIQDGKNVIMPFVFGKSVVEAVKYEQSGIKGPRIIFNKLFYDQLNIDAKKIVHQTFESKELYELNWTAIHYTMTGEDVMNEFQIDKLLLNQFYLNLLLPISNLWKAYNHLPISQHYFAFLKLVVKGILHYLENTKYRDFAKVKIKEYLIRVNLENKIDELMFIDKK